MPSGLDKVTFVKQDVMHVWTLFVNKTQLRVPARNLQDVSFNEMTLHAWGQVDIYQFASKDTIMHKTLMQPMGGMGGLNLR